MAYDVELVLDLLKGQIIKNIRKFHEAVHSVKVKYGANISDEVFEQALDRLKIELGETYDIPAKGIIGVARHRWYTGPQPEHRNWPKFVSRLSEDGWDANAIESINLSSTKILSRTPAPVFGNNPESGRGLVIGYVQSGKTTSFMSVIAKAADAGYRLIIVLSGVTNNLREQTQVAMNSFVAPSDDADWHWLTDADNDFTKKGNANNLLNNTTVVAVVKKNTTRLKHLQAWLASASPEIRKATPMLVIDDEADQASVNTDRGKTRRTAVNKRLTALLDTNVMPTNSYIGYTATPFANLLIDPNDQDDIFPRDFICSLKKGSGYFGPEELFGRDPIDEDDQGNSAGMDLIRYIPDSDIQELGTAANPNASRPAAISNELERALDWFLIATAVRKLREKNKFWSSMLIHTSGRIKSHEDLVSVIKDTYLHELRSNLAFHLVRLEKLWNEEASHSIDDKSAPKWAEIAENLEFVLSNTRVVMDNSRSIDRLNYGPDEDPGPVIAIGGNTLSRGLVLKGLISSYFLRTSKTYDVLLQMGRWFGYRKGYEDLQRIWMPLELSTWFRDLALVETEIRKQIENFEAGDVLPRDLPVLIRTHPKMQVTAKPGSARKAQIGFSEKREETIIFPAEDKNWLKTNLDAGTEFIREIDKELGFKQVPGKTTFLAENVHRDVVIKFLNKYQFSNDAKVVTKEPLLSYIEKVSQANNELMTWQVYVYSPGQSLLANGYSFANGISVNRVVRSKLNSSQKSANIHHLANTSDITFGLPKEASARVAELKKQGITSFAAWNALRAEFGLGNVGLLGLYLVDKDSKPKDSSKSDRKPLDAANDVLGISLFFPKSKVANAHVDYLGPRPFVPEVIDEDTEDYLDDADALDEADASSDDGAP
jgi:hypothetical protein